MAAELRQSLPRRAAILRIIRESTVRNQDELVRALHKQGFDATQSSVSRDLRELGVAKAGDHYIIAPSEQPLPANHFASVTNFVVGVRTAGDSLTIVQTTPGTANSVAVAIDKSDWPEVAGTISGVAAVQPNPFDFYLRPGDRIEAEIEGVGVLRNHVVPWSAAHDTPPYFVSLCLGRLAGILNRLMRTDEATAMMEQALSSAAAPETANHQAYARAAWPTVFMMVSISMRSCMPSTVSVRRGFNQSKTGGNSA